jgi:hypothetical protein
MALRRRPKVSGNMAIKVVGDWGLCASDSIITTLGIEGGWSNPLAEATILIEPSEIIIEGWKNIAETTLLIEPSEIIIEGWKNIAETIFDMLLPIGCQTDEDCPEGYVCRNGVCVPEGGVGGFPWAWLAVGGGALAAIALIISAQKPKKPPPKTKK